MRIVCAGGGPAGLYTAILTRLRSPQHGVTVVERNPRGATHGWGVTFGEDFLDDLHRTDPVTARAVRDAALLWADQVVLVGDRRPVHLGGKYGYSMGRAALLDLLTARAEELGVDLRFATELDGDHTRQADLVVAADGVGSRLRAAHPEHFGTTVDTGRNRYLWLGADTAVTSFVFAFERTPAGWMWIYAYPSSGGTSTLIAECAPETWTGLGLDQLAPEAGVKLVEEIFARPLGGARLLAPLGGLAASPWLNFRHVRNATWVRDDVVLAGDAAHTTHFSIGSGTVLAMQDAIALVDVLPAGPAGLPAALARYDAGRRAALDPVQAMALRSMRWFEDVDAHLAADPVRLGYSLLDRRGDQPAWHYHLHRATQVGGVRGVRRRLTAARRGVRAVRRGDLRPAQLPGHVLRG